MDFLDAVVVIEAFPLLMAIQFWFFQLMIVLLW